MWRKLIMGGINFSWLAVWVPRPDWLRRKSDFREIVIKLLDDICETAVELSVHTAYRYNGYRCICNVKNKAIRGLKNRFFSCIISDFVLNYA